MSKKGWLITLAFTGVVILVWILSVVVFTKPNIELSPKLQDALEIVDPDFDQETLDKVGSVYKPAIVVPNATPTPTPTPVSTPRSSPTLNPTTTPSTGSGILNP
jgi:hypothetical protein